jgi:cellulose synthase/poly-beta-1,6-N-acetylglucosamine synthase-like glycosyltransferase
MFVETVFLIVSLTVTLLFFLYGFNHYYILNAARKYRSPKLPPNRSGYKPGVAIHLPIYNEKYVIDRLIAACACMATSYEMDRVNILIIDDSDDETADLVDQLVSEYQEKRFRIGVLRRDSREGFKAGALQAALEQTAEEFIAIFDADFIPSADFLVLTLPYFVEDECLGIIQSRWTHTNRDYNFLTQAIALGIDVHFLIEQTGRYAAGCLQNFNGSGGVLRKSALLQAGGWQADTLAEDLDASYRMQMQGYRTLYLRDLLSPGETPPTVPSFKKQQGRWACGSLRTARKLLPTLLTDRKLAFKIRVEALIHLTAYLVHPLMFVSFTLACLATFLGVDSLRIANLYARLQGGLNSEMFRVSAEQAPEYLAWGSIGLLILLCTVAAWIPPMVALRGQHISLPRKLSSFIILFLLGCGISLSNTIEAGKALFSNRSWEFKRTPKYAVRQGGEWRDKRYQVSLDVVWLLELLSVCLGGFAIWDALRHSNYGVLLILIPFTLAYTFVALLTILQSRPDKAG